MRKAILFVALMVSAVGLGVSSNGNVGVGTNVAEQYEMMAEWVTDDHAFYLEGNKVETMVGMPNKITHYSIKAYFSDKYVVYDIDEYIIAEEALIKLTTMWANGTIEERITMIIDWEVNL